MGPSVALILPFAHRLNEGSLLMTGVTFRANLLRVSDVPDPLHAIMHHVRQYSSAGDTTSEVLNVDKY